MREIEVTSLGLVEYDDGLDLQDALRRRVTAREIPDQLLLLEHPPVVTIGRNAGEENLVAAPDELARRGIELHHTGRGGDVTFHGPGQIVGYPIVDLNPDRRDVHRYVRDLEEVLIRSLADFDVKSGRIPGLTGVWIGDLKIAAIGVRISRWVTSHGFALNVGTDLSFFQTIVPCGITDRGVTSLSRVLGRDIAPDDVRASLVRRFAEIFEREPVERRVTNRSVQVQVWRKAAAGRTEVLLLKRTPRDGGFWQPVTGMIERGEEPSDTAIREVAEETGLVGSVVDLEYVRDFRISRRYVGGSGVSPWINREHAFALEANGAAVRLDEHEHEEYRWVAPDRARELFKWRGNMRALERLERRIVA